MKKIILAALVALFTLSCVEKQATPEPIWNGATMVFCANIGQLHAKSGLAEMDLSKLEQEIDKEATINPMEATIIKSIIRNPNASGFNLDNPVYLAIGEYVDDINNYNAIASIEVESAMAVDNFFKTVAEDLTDVDFKLEGNTRIIRVDEEGIIIGYDDKRLVAIGSEDEACDLYSVLLKHMKYAPADMSRFESNDVAVYFDINQAYDLVNTPNEEEAMEDVDEVDLSEYFNEGATVLTGISFDQGSLSYTANISGVSEDVTKLFKEINALSLKRLPPSPIALLDIGVNGEAFAELANVAIDATMKSLGGASNEFSIYKNIALGVIASISGDLMFALTDAEGTISKDIFGDKQILFTSANALFTADVVDDYIMKNIDTYAGGFLTKQKNGYSVNAFGNRLTIAQQENLFYVGVNNNGSIKKDSAADHEWYNDVVGSYLFAMVDFDKLFKSGYGRVALKVMLDNIKNPADKINATRLISSVDRAYITISGEEDRMRGELMVVAHDKSQNSLQTIVEMYYDLAFN